MIQVNLN